MWEATTGPSMRSASRWNTNLNSEGGEEDHIQSIAATVETGMSNDETNDERSTKPEIQRPYLCHSDFGLL